MISFVNDIVRYINSSWFARTFLLFSHIIHTFLLLVLINLEVPYSHIILYQQYLDLGICCFLMISAFVALFSKKHRTIWKSDSAQSKVLSFTKVSSSPKPLTIWNFSIRRLNYARKANVTWKTKAVDPNKTNSII